MSAGAGAQLAPLTPAHPSPAAAASTPTAASPTKHLPKLPRQRKQPVQTENWDDDFEFSLPAKPKQQATPRPAPIVTPKRESLGLSEGSRGNSWRSSYDSPDSFDEDWDEPGPSRTPTAFRQQLSKATPVMLATSPTTHLQLPRGSNSHSPSLPSPSTPSNGSHRNLATVTPVAAASPTKAPRRSSEGSPVSTHRAKLGKRSSASLVPVEAAVASASASEVNLLTAHGLSPAHRSSPNLLYVTPDGRSPQTRARSNSKPSTPSPLGSGGEVAADLRRVPSPTKQSRKPLPKSSPSVVSLASRSPAASNMSPASTNGSALPSRSPSKSPEPEKGKKPRFWKRLSAGPSTASPDGATSPFRRRRSTSAVNLAPASSVSPPVPPLPPLPVNLRSASGQFSTGSTLSLLSPSPGAPSPGGPGPSPGGSVGSPIKSAGTHFGARSASSLLQQNREYRALTASPVPYPYSTPNGVASSSSINMAASPHSSRYALNPTTAGEDEVQASTRPRTFSPGFHLPSPSPGSPYAQRAAAMSATSVPYSSPLSRGEAPVDEDDTDTEVETGKTPVGRKKIRPVSAMPAPRPVDSGLTRTYNQVNASVPCLSPRQPQVATLPPSASTTSSHQTRLSSSPSTTATSITSSGNSQGLSSTHTTLRRLTSFSKKHGRRLSGGWKFGSTSSTSTTGSGEKAGGHTLETVNGSPSKPSVDASRSAVEMQRPVVPGQAFDDDGVQTAVLPPQRSTDPPASAPAATTTQSMGPDPWATDAAPRDATAKGKPPKERRRTSFNDFVIPTEVMAKQKELKRGIGAVKKFAGGIQALKILVDTHERVTNDVLTIGSEDDTKLFVALEKEYSQWWEMATVLIEVGSTGSADADVPMGPPSTASSRQISGADEARSLSETSSKLSTSTMATITTSRKSTMSDPPVDVFHTGVGGPPKASPPPDPYRASTGRHDLSKRQLEVLRTMLTTPVEASDSVVATVDRQAAARAAAALAQAELQKTPSQQMPPPQWTNTQRSSVVPPMPARQNSGPNGTNGSPADGYVWPSPSYPSPETAGQMAQPKGGRSGMTGLKDFLKSMRRKSQLPPLPTAQTSPGGTVQTPVKPKRGHRPPPIKTTTLDELESPPESPLQTAATDGMYQTQRSFTTLPVTSGTEGSPKASKKRRPSIKNIFRQSSGNWAEFMRSTPPSSPNGVIRQRNASSASLAPPLVDGRPPSRSRRSSVASSHLPRQPSIPALARLKMGKGATYGQLGVAESPTASPTRPGSRHRPSLGQSDAPATPPVPKPLISDGEHTMRLKSRALGLGHPAEGSPRALSSPARQGTGGSDLVLDEAPRSRSDGGLRAGGDEIFIALTPENLPVLLDYARQCERKLEQWHQRAVHLESGMPTVTGVLSGASKPAPRVPTWGRV
ncbi:hypothetical protein Q8F55_004674 [Vanrija albida]|uniref:Uncharacterized protein n=1 Tax=Vanrija albida TaxID=181172 RepID=A0ABR3Q7E2_9TREE